MKTILQKILIILFSCLLFLSGTVRAFAEGEDQKNDNTIDLTATYYVLTVQQDRSLTVPFSVDWFKNDARFYSHDLAKASLGLAVSSFRPNSRLSDPGRSADASAISYLSQAGFTDIQSDDYDKNPSIYTVSTIMGHQQIGSGDDAFEMIAIGVCGQGYMDEWESNFSISDGDFEGQEIHSGFERSSRLIYDRIFGYIANHHLSGTIKVWITGFSRAAAVSNVTAKWLCDSDVFDEDTVFAYTFATPQTTMKAEEGKYQNIYNIVGKSDPVPMIPFSDWGFGRYGVTLTTPSVEADSAFQEKRIKANAIYKEITGIDYWVNPEMDKQIRNILYYLLKICPDVPTYKISLQDQLIHLWEDRSPVNVISRFLDIASDPLLIQESNRDEANAFLDYMAYLLIDALTNRNSFRTYNRNASVGSNLAQAHTPELYISWVFSADEGTELYSANDAYTYLLISGNVDVTLKHDGKIVEQLKHSESQGHDGNIYLLRTEDVVTATLPRDDDYDVEITPTEFTFSMVVQAQHSVNQLSPLNTGYVYYEMEEGDVVKISIDKDGTMNTTKNGVHDEGMLLESDEYMNNSEFISAERRNPLNLPWRTLAILSISAVIIAVSLVIYQIVWVIARFRFRHLVRRGMIRSGTKFRSLPMFCSFWMFQLFLIGEFYSALFRDSLSITLTFKAAIGMLGVAVATMAYDSHKSNLNRSIQFAMLLLMCADVTTRINVMTGAVLHVISYLYLTWTFIREEKPVLSQIMIWIFLCVVAAIITYIQPANPFGSKIYIVLYVWAALTMACASFPMPRRCLTASILLFLAGILTILNIVLGEPFLVHILSLGTYYAGVSTLASTGLRVPLARLVPTYVDEEEIEDAA